MNEDFIEKTVLEPMSKLRKHELSEPQAVMLNAVIKASEQVEIDNLYDFMSEKMWVLRAIEKRVNTMLTANIDKGVQLITAFLLDGNIGRCIIYLYYFQWWAKTNNKKSVSIDDFCYKIFSQGLPSEEDLKVLWDSQKIKGENAIDIPKFSESIQIKE